MTKLNNKWSSALFLTLLVHSIFFIIIYTHVSVRQKNTDPLTHSSTMIGHHYDNAPTTLETLSDVPTTLTDAPSSKEGGKNLTSTTTRMQPQPVFSSGTEEAELVPITPTKTTQGQKTTADTTSSQQPTVAEPTSLSQKDKDNTRPSNATTTQATEETRLSSLKAEAGLLAVDTPQAVKAQQNIVTEKTHDEAKTEAEAANEELRAAIALVKARNQQQIKQATDIHTDDTPTTKTDATTATPESKGSK